jgi:hypothetical protein
LRYTPFAEASATASHLVCTFSLQFTVGEFGTSPTTRRFDAKTPSASVYRFRQVGLGDPDATLAGMETDFDSHSARDDCPLANGRTPSGAALAIGGLAAK